MDTSNSTKVVEDCSGSEVNRTIVLRDLIAENVALELLRSIDQVTVGTLDFDTRFTLDDEGKVRVSCEMYAQAVITKRRTVALAIGMLLLVSATMQSLLGWLVGLHEYWVLLVKLYG